MYCSISVSYEILYPLSLVLTHGTFHVCRDGAVYLPSPSRTSNFPSGSKHRRVRNHVWLSHQRVRAHVISTVTPMISANPFIQGFGSAPKTTHELGMAAYAASVRNVWPLPERHGEHVSDGDNARQ